MEASRHRKHSEEEGAADRRRVYGEARALVLRLCRPEKTERRQAFLEQSKCGPAERERISGGYALAVMRDPFTDFFAASLPASEVPRLIRSSFLPFCFLFFLLRFAFRLTGSSFLERLFFLPLSSLIPFSCSHRPLHSRFCRQFFFSLFEVFLVVLGQHRPDRKSSICCLATWVFRRRRKDKGSVRR